MARRDIYLISYFNDDNSGDPASAKRILHDATLADFIRPVHIDSKLFNYKVINVKKYEIINNRVNKT